MPQFISQEEFEYQTMCGSTQEVFVYGLGHVQWTPIDPIRWAIYSVQIHFIQPGIIRLNLK